VNDKIEGLLASGRALLASGRPRDAAFAFERVLLLAPSDPDGRLWLERGSTLIVSRFVPCPFSSSRRTCLPGTRRSST